MSEFEKQYNDYKAGHQTLERFAAWVQGHRFADPSYVAEREKLSPEVRYLATESYDRSEPGTWGEVDLFYYTGKLTDEEYDAIRGDDE